MEELVSLRRGGEASGSAWLAWSAEGGAATTEGRWLSEVVCMCERGRRSSLLLGGASARLGAGSILWPTHALGNGQTEHNPIINDTDRASQLRTSQSKGRRLQRCLDAGDRPRTRLWRAENLCPAEPGPKRVAGIDPHKRAWRLWEVKPEPDRTLGGPRGRIRRRSTRSGERDGYEREGEGKQAGGRSWQIRGR
jgi:hypothetical protein